VAIRQLRRIKDMGSCSPPFTTEIARALGERYEPA
jgi:hypothetical protein